MYFVKHELDFYLSFRRISCLKRLMKCIRTPNVTLTYKNNTIFTVNMKGVKNLKSSNNSQII
jgi:hypothetical protein